MTHYDDPLPLPDDPPPADTGAVVTDPWVVRAVVLGLVACVLGVVIAASWLNATDSSPLPGELVAIAPTGIGALGALLAGTLVKRA